jgi:hypothetical protein
MDRVDAEGIKLTSADYLPPPDVEAAVAELGLAEEWYGKFNRESQTLPVLDLRESAMRLGLLRKYKGALLATPRGRKLRDDPVALWWHLARQLPPAKLARNEMHASLLLLAAVAAGPLAGPDPLEYVARILNEVGWQSTDGTPITDWQARHAAEDTHLALRRFGALVQDWHKLSAPAANPRRRHIRPRRTPHLARIRHCGRRFQFNLSRTNRGASPAPPFHPVSWSALFLIPQNSVSTL